MAKKYCPSCGTEHNYTVTVPKFCQECGKPMEGFVQASAPEPVAQPMAHVSPFASQQPAIQPMSTEPINQDEADIAAINNARSQNIAIAAEVEPFADNRVTIGNEVGTGAFGMPKRNAYTPKNGSAAKDILEMCKPIRESKEIGE